MAIRMAAIGTTDIWNVHHTMSISGPSSRKEDVDVDMPGTDEDDEFVIETENVQPVQVEMRRMVESALHAFQETTLDRRIEAIIKTKVICLL